MKPSVFVDTSFLKALIDERDDFYSQAISVSEKLAENNCLLITTNFVLDESYTLLRVRKNLASAKKLRELMFNPLNRTKIIRVTSIDEAEAWEMFLKPWRGLSFTDCTSFAVMKRLDLKEVATFDDHFSKAGFKVLK